MPCDRRNGWHSLAACVLLPYCAAAESDVAKLYLLAVRAIRSDLLETGFVPGHVQRPSQRPQGAGEWAPALAAGLRTGWQYPAMQQFVLKRHES